MGLGCSGPVFMGINRGFPEGTHHPRGHGTEFAPSERPPDGDVGQSLNFKHSKRALERWAVGVQAAVAKHPHLGDHA